jgi:hypothetical protein
MAGEVPSLAKIDIFGKDKGYSSIVWKIERVLGAWFLLFAFHLDFVNKPFLFLSDLISFDTAPFFSWIRSWEFTLPAHELN